MIYAYSLSRSVIRNEFNKDIFRFRVAGQIKKKLIKFSRYLYLIVEESPLLQDRMNPDDRTNIPRQIPPASCHSQVLVGIQSVGIYHEISVIHVDLGSL